MGKEEQNEGQNEGQSEGQNEGQSEELLRVENLEIHYPVREGFWGKTKRNIKAVDGISFRVRSGESVGLIGESGSGKTTIAKGILGLLGEKIRGSIKFEGKEVHNLRGKELKRLRKDMQIVFQDPYSSLNPRMTIGSIVEEGLTIHKIGESRKERQKKVEEVLEEVGISKDFYNLYPHEFSGGQRQRIGIARALILKPRLVICDEPVSALDVSVQIQVLNLMNKLQRDYKLTYIFISHDLSVVDYFCNRIIIIYLGKVMEMGNRDDIVQGSKHPYTNALIESIPKPDPRARKELRIIEGDIPSAIEVPSGCVFRTRCPIATIECSKEEPELKLVGNEHYCACIHVE